MEVGDLKIACQALAMNSGETTGNFPVLRLILERCLYTCVGLEKEVLNSVRQPERWFKNVKNEAR